jgi:hypothetical protein
VSPAKANRINGYIYEELAPGTWGAIASDGTVVASASHRKQGEAIRLCVELVYAINRNIVFDRDNWRCVRCLSFRDLQCHHKKHRAMGGANRDDRPEALESICADCHRSEHGG